MGSAGVEAFGFSILKLFRMPAVEFVYDVCYVAFAVNEFSFVIQAVAVGGHAVEPDLLCRF